ncbi:Gfo/Idh/MocA family oxidoreductase [Acidobacteria bacterium AH-259-O06]|nr:Gfo/Idh/MocA family oxidoreductase [Acidobacteria bacterium AH-259-O06]
MGIKQKNLRSGNKSSRRQFLGQATGAVASASLLSLAKAAPAKARPVRKVTGRVLGANDRINLGFIGCGMRFQGLGRAFKDRKEKKGDFEYTAVCDVWEPRLRYAQEKTKAAKTYRDYREILQRSDIDGVLIIVPDHWHYRMAEEACLAGKDVYLEKPMTYTIEESAKLNDVVNQTQRILQVGGSGPSTRLYWKVNEYIEAGKMGKILWGLISYNRNTRTGMWDYPIPGVGSEHWPDTEVSDKNLDWNMWLGPAPKRPFSLERYFRWRKYWDYSGGNATDLLYHRLGAMCTMVGFHFPTQVVGAGGIYVQKNREVPDTYMTVVEYPGEYSVNMISCMGNAQSAPISIYGNWGTLQIIQERVQAGDSMGDQTRRPRRRIREYALVKAERQFTEEFKEANHGQAEVTIEPEESTHLVDNWLDSMRSREKPVYDVLKGYQVMVAIKLGVDSYREGKVMAFDPVSRRVSGRVPERKVYLPPEA